MGIATHHGAMDGFSALHFINTWSGIARGAEDTVVAALDRTLLRARFPPTVHFEYQRCNPRHQRSTTSPNPPVATLKLSKDQLVSLKNSIAGGRRRHVSTYEAVTAYAWRCACEARQMGGDQETRLYMTADARTRLKPPLPPGYFGNAILRTSVAAATGKILSSPLQSTAEKIHDAVVRVDDEYVRSVIDFLESWQESQKDLWPSAGCIYRRTSQTSGGGSRCSFSVRS